MLILTFPEVLDRFGTGSVGKSSKSWLNSCCSGDKARFFEGEALRDGVGDGCESLTGMCVIFFPCRVCVVVTSNMSGLAPKSLIFIISNSGLKMQVSRRIQTAWKYMCCNHVEPCAKSWPVSDMRHKMHLNRPHCGSATGLWDIYLQDRYNA
jgi:hypothetical protein